MKPEAPMESVITLRCNRISAIAFDLIGTNTVIAVLLAPALYIPQDNIWRGKKMWLIQRQIRYYIISIPMEKILQYLLLAE
jgi:hypothetical protein